MKEIEDELLMCDQFQPLLQTLKELEKKHISGEILKTNYRSRGRTCTSYFRDGYRKVINRDENRPDEVSLRLD